MFITTKSVYIGISLSFTSLCHVQFFVTPWTAARQASLSITNSQILLKLMSIKLVMSSNHLILCHSLLVLSSIFPSIRVFSNESVLPIRWPKYWSSSFSISLPNEYSELMLHWLVQSPCSLRDSQKSSPTPQFRSISSSVLSFFMVQLSHPYKTSGKTIPLTRWNFISKLTSLFFNMLSRLIIAFLPRSKHLFISWLQSPSSMILEPMKIKSDIVSIVSPSICHELMGPDAIFLVFWMFSFKPVFSLSSFTFIKRLFSSSSVSVIKVSSVYLIFLIFLLAILIPVCASSSPTFRMMYSAYKLNKQGDNIQPWHTPFPIWNQSVVPCPVLTVASWPGYRFLKRQVKWSGIPISFRIFLSLLWSPQRLWHGQ